MNPTPDVLERWSSQVELIKLKHPIPVRIAKGSTGFDVFCKPLHLVGSGNTMEKALEMFFDHLMMDYYEHSLNPGEQNHEDEEHGKRLRRFFNTTGQEFRKKLLDFHFGA